jgi:hypothetical protein
MLSVQAAHRGDDLHVQTNLGRLDPCDLPAVFAALGQHVGLDGEALRKAASTSAGEPPDPRYPALRVLIARAQADWARWGARLVSEVQKLVSTGKLLPMTPVNEALLRDLLEGHHLQIVASFTGTSTHEERRKELVRRGLIEPQAGPGLIETAWRLGRRLDMLVPHGVPTQQAPPFDAILRAAASAPRPTAQDRAALAYVQRRAAIYMRRPAEAATSEVARLLNEEEYRVVRGATGRAVEQRMGSKRLERELAEALTGHPTLANDLERVARTELAFAHCQGAYEALKAQTAEAGHADPEVYKFVSPDACSDCRRIWGPPSAPHHFRLSFVEEREARGGNFRTPRKEWGPVIGPVHPNCTEGPLMYFDASLVDAINEAADAFLKR